MRPSKLVLPPSTPSMSEFRVNSEYRVLLEYAVLEFVFYSLLVRYSFFSVLEYSLLETDVLEYEYFVLGSLEAE